jgi:hypothetical protein
MFLTFLLILLSFQNIFSQQKQFPVWLEIHPLAWRYFQLLDKDPFVELIKDELEKSFNNALNSYLNKKDEIKNINSNQSTQCIIDAMNKLVNDIQDFDYLIVLGIPVPYKFKKSITIFFWIDSGFGNQFGLHSLNASNFNGDKDLHGGTDNKEKIYIYNAYKDFTLVRIKAAVENNNSSCEYRHLFPHWSLPSGTKLSQPWQYDGTPKFSIARAYPKSYSAKNVFLIGEVKYNS